jgi:hypothetical protein
MTHIHVHAGGMEKVSPISEILAHHRDLVFQFNEGMTPVLIKPSQLGDLKFLRN